MSQRVAHDLQFATRLVNYGPVVLISTTDGEHDNVCTVAWNVPLKKSPPTFGLALSTKGKTFANATATGTLGINVPTADLVDLLLYCGSKSGHDTDKIAGWPIALHRGSELRELPLVSACAAWLECRVVEVAKVGPTELTVVEAVAISARQGALDEDHAWNSVDFPSVHHAGGRLFLSGQPLRAEGEKR